MNKLSRMLSNRLSETNMSIRRAGLQIGVSHATVARAVNGETVEVDTLVRIADFLRVSIISLIDETAKSFTRFWGKWYIIFRDVEFRSNLSLFSSQQQEYPIFVNSTSK